jgi:hypothetical protein
LLESIYRTFGEPANWLSAVGEPIYGLSVRRTAEEDIPVEFGASSRAVVERIVLRVRVAEAPGPAKGDRVEILDDGEVIGAYLVTDRPLKVRFGLEWKVEVKAVE